MASTPRRIHRGPPVHAFKPHSFQPFGDRWGFAACDRNVIRAYLTHDMDEVTCPTCLDNLAQDTIARLRSLSDPCTECDGIGVIAEGTGDSTNLVTCPVCVGSRWMQQPPTGPVYK